MPQPTAKGDWQLIQACFLIVFLPISSNDPLQLLARLENTRVLRRLWPHPSSDLIYFTICLLLFYMYGGFSACV